MKRALPLLLLSLLLMGQDCEPEPPPEGGNTYCKGNEYTIFDQIMEGAGSIWNTIIGGVESTDRRATVQVLFDGSYCSGVAINPHTVLTAGHCGPETDTQHVIRIEGDPTPYTSAYHVVHPDYLRYLANPSDQEARKSDLMLILFDDALPGPFVGNFYSSQLTDMCLGLVAQGYGRWEEPGAMLREAKYIITQETDKYLISRLAPEGKICFGDSGGPLYADVNGRPHIAGITTTTMSRDCLVGGTHVKATGYVGWIYENMK